MGAAISSFERDFSRQLMLDFSSLDVEVLPLAGVARCVIDRHLVAPRREWARQYRQLNGITLQFRYDLSSLDIEVSSLAGVARCVTDRHLVAPRREWARQYRERCFSSIPVRSRVT